MVQDRLPRLPVRHRAFWLDPALGAEAVARTRMQIEVHDGMVLDAIDLRLDYLVLDDRKRGWPGCSAEEQLAETISAGSIATLYLTDLHRLLVPSREFALALLRRGRDGIGHWEAAFHQWELVDEVDLAGADLSGLDLSGYRFRRCRLDGADLSGTTLDGATFDWPAGLDFGPIAGRRGLAVSNPERCGFDGLDLREVRLTSRLVACSFRRAGLAGVGLPIRIDGCDFSGADLVAADLVGRVTTAFVAEGAVLDRADLLGAKLPAARLAAASLAEAGLDQADLARADLRGANLAGATLFHANLAGADLRGADLRNADLRAAVLTADLAGADLRGAEYDEATAFPDGFDPSGAGLRLRATFRLEREPRPEEPPATGPATPVTPYDGFCGRLAWFLNERLVRHLRARAEVGEGELFREVGDGEVAGIFVDADSVARLYVCRLRLSGERTCATNYGVLCGRFQDGICPHLAQLLLAVAWDGSLHTYPLERWLQLGYSRGPVVDRAGVQAILARHAALSAPHFRPLETLPEDFYAG